MPRVKILLLMLLIFVNVTPALCASVEGGWNEVGIRTGFQADTRHEYFRQHEAYAVYGLPWEWRTSSGWGLAPQANVSAGALQGDKETAFIGSVGTGIAFNKPDNGISMDLGINADLLDRRQIGNQDFGSILLFGAYLGLSYRFDCGLKIGYRIQHLSNGHIFYNHVPNPGLDMHLVGVSWNY
jgi:hypothetical protein